MEWLHSKYFFTNTWKIMAFLYKIVYSIFFLFFLSISVLSAQVDSTKDSTIGNLQKPTKEFYGLASFYANKFVGRKTANGEIFSQDKYTAACNVLPLGTWIKVTNLRNGKSVIVKTNDRLHPKVNRLVDLSRISAQKLNFINSGLVKVRIEVISHKQRKGKRK